MHDTAIEDELYLLSKVPSSNIMTFKGYEINGNTFYTIVQDKKSTNQNSGVRFDVATSRGKDTYYGYIEEISELYYGRDLKIPLFQCKWVNMTGGGVKEDPQYGMTIVDHKIALFGATTLHATGPEHGKVKHGMELLKEFNKSPLVTLSQKGSENTIASM